MNHPPVWLDHILNIGNAACEGVLQARAAKREARRAARDEAAVPPHWRARPPTQETPTVSAPQAPPREAPPVSPQPAVVPLVLPRVVAPWERPPRARSAQPSSTAPAVPAQHTSPVAPAMHTEPASPACPTPESTAPSPAPAPAPPAPGCQKLDKNDQAPEPPAATHQLELDFTAKPVPSAEPAQSSTSSTPPKPDDAEHTAAASRLAALLGQVVGDIVSDTLENVLDRQERRFVQMLDHQDARFEEMLDRQAKSHAADMTWIAEMNAENLRTILREVIGERSSPPATPPAEAPQAMTATIVEVVEDLQETLRLGFGEIRAGLNRHHNEMMAVVRSEIRPLAQAALARLIREAQEPADVPQSALEGSPPPVGAAPKPDPERSPASHVASATTPAARPGEGPTDLTEGAPVTSSSPLTSTQWKHIHAVLGDDEGDEDDRAPDDDARPPLRYHPPDDTLAHPAEASA